MRPMKKSNLVQSTVAAFTLAEAMVGTLIFGLVALGAMQTVTQGLQLLEDAQDVNRINQTIQYQMESLRSTGWSTLIEMADNSSMAKQSIPVDAYGTPLTVNNVSGGALSGILVLDDGVEGEIPFDWKAFEMIQTIEWDDTKADMLHCTVYITWTNTRNKSDSLTYSTTCTAQGLNAYFTRTQ